MKKSKCTEISVEKGDVMFKQGDMAVYPAHGVGQIEAIEKREIGGIKQKFYVMKILDSSMVVMIPTKSCDAVGLRNIISAGEVDKVFDILKMRDIEIDAQPWNQRYREYMQRIKTGSVYEIAAVLRDLYLLKDDKTLSFGERKMMDTAKSLLVKELAIANQVKEDLVATQVDGIFS